MLVGIPLPCMEIQRSVRVVFSAQATCYRLAGTVGYFDGIPIPADCCRRELCAATNLLVDNSGHRIGHLFIIDTIQNHIGYQYLSVDIFRRRLCLYQPQKFGQFLFGKLDIHQRIVSLRKILRKFRVLRYIIRIHTHGYKKLPVLFLLGFCFFLCNTFLYICNQFIIP